MVMLVWVWWVPIAVLTEVGLLPESLIADFTGQKQFMFGVSICRTVELNWRSNRWWNVH